MSPRARVRPCLLLLASGLALLFARPAAAQDRVLVWSIQATGSAEAGMLREQAYHSLSGGLAAAGLAVVPRQEVGTKLAAAPGLVGCETSTCLKRVAEILGVRRIIRAQLEIFGSSYVYRLEWLGADGRLRNRAEGRCDVCTVAELNEQVSQLAVRLARAKEVEPAPTPSGPAATPPGGPAATPAAPRAATTPPPPGPQRDHPPRRISPMWKWIAGGTSLAALILGSTLVAVDGHGTCTPANAGGKCPRILDTAAGGWTLAAVGIAGLIGTGVWFWLDRPMTDRRHATAGGVGLRLGF
jgi:hypothetical protein